MATDYTAQINAAQQSVTYTNATAGNLAVYNAELNNGTTMAQIDQQIVNDPFTTANVDPVIALYQAAFGRVPDAAGLKAEVQALESGVPLIPTSATSTNSLVFQFASSPEFMARYGVTPTSPSTTALVYLLYQNVLGRAPDAAGLAYWSSQPLNAQQLLAAFAVPSLDPEYAKDIAPQVKSFEYDETGASGSQPVPTTGSLFNVQVNAGSTSGSTVAGQTFNLTGTPTDVYTLTNADPTHKTTNLGDTFFLNAGEPTGTIIQDGTGPNSLNISGLGAAPYSPTQISGVQTINDTTTASHTINFANFTGVNTVNDLKGTGGTTTTYMNLESNAAVGVSGETGSHLLHVQYDAGTTAANIVVGADGGGAGNLVELAVTTASGANVTTDNFTTTGGNNSIADGAGIPNTSLTTVHISGSGNLTYIVNPGDTALATLTDSGTGADTIGAGGLTFTPAGTVTLANGNDTLTAIFLSTGTVTAGNGNDTFNLTSTATKALTISVGNGADTLNFTANAAHQVTIGTGNDTLNVTTGGNVVNGAGAAATTSVTDAEATSITGFNTSKDVFNLHVGAGNVGTTAITTLTGTQDSTVAASATLQKAAAAAAAFEVPGATPNTHGEVAFDFGGNTYVEYNATIDAFSAGDTLVKLVGVNALNLNASSLHVVA